MRKWQPTPVFLSGESHGQRSLAGYSPWGRKELDMTEHSHPHTYTPTYTLPIFSLLPGTPSPFLGGQWKELLPDYFVWQAKFDSNPNPC